MKRILGIDASIPRGSVALIQHDHILSQKTLEGSASFSGCLLWMVDEVLSEAGTDLTGVDGFGITTGPGSFTGLRVGLSLVKGLVLATGKPFTGVDTLEAVAACAQPGPEPVCALLDARKKEVYCAFFRFERDEIHRTSPDRSLKPEELCGQIHDRTVFIGSGLETYGGFLLENLKSKFLSPLLLENRTVAASTALLAGSHLCTDPRGNLDTLTLNYVRKPEAELNRLGRI